MPITEEDKEAIGVSLIEIGKTLTYQTVTLAELQTRLITLEQRFEDHVKNGGRGRE